MYSISTNYGAIIYRSGAPPRSGYRHTFGLAHVKRKVKKVEPSAIGSDIREPVLS